MSRCYAEITREGKIARLVYQDETGVYYYSPEAKKEKLIQMHLCDETTIKLPEWDKPRKVKTNTKEFLDFVRRCERNYYMETTPTEIREYEGIREEVIQAAMKDFGQARLDS